MPAPDDLWHFLTFFKISLSISESLHFPEITVMLSYAWNCRTGIHKAMQQYTTVLVPIPNKSATVFLVVQIATFQLHTEIGTRKATAQMPQDLIIAFKCKMSVISSP